MNAATMAEAALLALGVAALWLGAFGLLRLPNAFARLHCVGFAGAAGSFCFTTAVVIDRGGGRSGSSHSRRGYSCCSLAPLPLMRPGVRCGFGRKLTPLQMGLFLLLALSGTGVVLTREPRRQVIMMGFNGLVLALLFLVLQAPDVAFSELAVVTVALPFLFLIALAGVRINEHRQQAEKR